jgi:putative FmdB family regulatory protein
MPTYRYQCQGCEHEFEEFQSMSSKPLRRCPQCGKLKLDRLIGPGAGVLFKGSGFYATDYRSSSYKSAEKTAEPGGKSASDTPCTGQPKTCAERGGPCANKPAGES